MSPTINTTMTKATYHVFCQMQLDGIRAAREVRLARTNCRFLGLTIHRVQNLYFGRITSWKEAHSSDLLIRTLKHVSFL